VPATPISERDDRLSRLRSRMAERGLDAMLLGSKGHWWTGRGAMRYLGDFHLWGHDAMILLPIEGDPAAAVTSPAVASMIARHGWIDDCRGDVLVVPAIAAATRDRGLERAHIGTYGWPWIVADGIARRVEEELPNARLEPADDVFEATRMVKSELEIEQNRALWELAQRCMERFVEVATAGVPQRELAAEAAREALAGGARDILLLMGDRSDLYGPPTDAPLRCDDKVRFHMEICGESGHWCELTVTLAYRSATEDERRLMASELRAYEAVRAAARPDATLAELTALFEQTLHEDGWELGGPTRHFDFHGQGHDVIEFPWFAAEQPWGGTRDTQLAAGTILSYHPRRDVDAEIGWYPGVSDNLLVTDRGGEWLSRDWSHDWREVA
jgi:Xaa-Pro aminopeptidase